MVYRTMQGKVIDFEKLMRQNELTPAVGNMKVNARGDEIGPSGKIIRRREDIVNEYYEKNPKSRISTRTVKEEKIEPIIQAKEEPKPKKPIQPTIEE